MTQIDLFETDWINKIKDILDDINNSEGLPEDSLLRVENLSRDKNKVTSYSISIVKPDYPKGTNPNGFAKNALINIKASYNKKEGKEVLSVSVPDSFVTQVSTKFPNLLLVEKKSENTRANISTDSTELIEFLRFEIKVVLDKYFTEGSDSFGCCHLYEKCSDAKKCLHENKLYARGCTYGQHVSAGQIFYGKNRNV